MKLVLSASFTLLFVVIMVVHLLGFGPPLALGQIIWEDQYGNLVPLHESSVVKDASCAKTDAPPEADPIKCLWFWIWKPAHAYLQRNSYYYLKLEDDPVFTGYNPLAESLNTKQRARLWMHIRDNWGVVVDHRWLWGLEYDGCQTEIGYAVSNFTLALGALVEQLTTCCDYIYTHREELGSHDYSERVRVEGAMGREFTLNIIKIINAKPIPISEPPESRIIKSITYWCEVSALSLSVSMPIVVESEV